MYPRRYGWYAFCDHAELEKCTTADASLLDLTKYRRKEFDHADKMWKGLRVFVPAGHVGMLGPSETCVIALIAVRDPFRGVVGP